MGLNVEYIAGLFDGEGHVSITYTQRVTGKDPKLCVRLTNTHLPVLLMIQETYGGSVYAQRKAQEHYLQCFALSLNVEESKAFLTDVLPYLIIKRDQALAALEFSSTVYRRGRKRVSAEEIRTRESCMARVEEYKVQQWPMVYNKDLVLAEYRSSLH